MELTLNGNQPGKLAVTDAIFACAFNEPLVHQVVTAYMSAGRAGTHAQKTRSEVSGGGAKPFRQKGTGRARAGTIRSPIWRKGGVAFAAKPRDYSQKVNRKMYRGALRAILSELIRQDRLIVVDELSLAVPKTREAKILFAKYSTETDRVLVVSEAVDQNLYLATRNLINIDVRDTAAIDPVALVGADKVIITAPALKQIEEQLT